MWPTESSQVACKLMLSGGGSACPNPINGLLNRHPRAFECIEPVLVAEHACSHGGSRRCISQRFLLKKKRLLGCFTLIHRCSTEHLWLSCSLAALNHSLLYTTKLMCFWNRTQTLECRHCGAPSESEPHPQVVIEVYGKAQWTRRKATGALHLLCE